jgi:hypothetical protein
MISARNTQEITYDFFWSNLKKISKEKISTFEEFLTPKNRSSAIFPIYKKNSSASLIFLAYWVKKHGVNVIIKFTARDILGEVVGHDWMVVSEYRSITFSVDNFDYFKLSTQGFCGSIEVEVFSKNEPMYTFPAITLVYQSSNSNSVVHSCIRNYNESEEVNDYAINFPQTGFDITFSKDCLNYVCFFGGNKTSYNLTFLLEGGVSEIKTSIKLNNVNVGQMHLWYVEDLFDDLPCNSKVKLSISHDLDVFPRFYVGVEKHGFVPTLTHSFFDTSEKNFNYKAPLLHLRAENYSPEINYDSAFMIPIYPADTFKTSLLTYGQNLSHASQIQLSIFSDAGELIDQRKLDRQEAESFNQLSSFDVSAYIKLLNLSKSRTMSLHIGFVHNSSKPFPKRFKLGLNISNLEADLGSNICFAPLVLSEQSLEKPFNRRWFPLGGKIGFIASIHNTSVSRNSVKKSTAFSLEFVNNLGNILTRTISMSNNASLYLDINGDDELRSFFGEENGWCLVTSKSYHCDSYYFSSSGLQMGGDHAY